MTDSGQSRTFGARLGRAVANLLLALLNATLLLFIIAAVTGLLLIGKVRTLASDVAGEVTQAAVSATGLQPADALAELRMISTEMRDLRTAIEDRRTDVADRVAVLSARLDGLQSDLDTMRERKIALTDRIVDRATAAIGEAVKSLRSCEPGAGS